MRVNLSVADVRRRAAELYNGDSAPITEVKADGARLALDPGWWLTSLRVEFADENRHLAALRLYVEIGRQAAYPLREYSFPAFCDLVGGTFRPDKGVITAFLGNEILTIGTMGAQFNFDLTDAGRARLDKATS